MISQQRIDELLFSEPNMVKIIRQVEIEATAELRAERDALRALLAELQSGWTEGRTWTRGEWPSLVNRVAAALREGGK